jgi:RNA polymerase sigma factor (TIGR02999 family)
VQDIASLCYFDLRPIRRYQISNLSPESEAHASDQDKDQLDAIVGQLYRQLQLIAHHKLAPFGAGSLNTSGLVHEAYLKLASGATLKVNSQQHFKAIAATAMRQIIIDRARARQSLKNGGEFNFATLQESKAPWDDRVEEALFIDGLMQRLSAIDEKLSAIVEYRYFAGYSEQESALIMGVDVRTARRYWNRARKWLEQAYEQEEEHHSRP